MIQIIELKGTERKLYQLVAPLVMNQDVLKQNYNYPFRTSESYVWLVATDGKEVVGFIPLEHRGKNLIINNYYIKDSNTDILNALLERAIAITDKEMDLTSVTFVEHEQAFQAMGFSREKLWKRYVKMKKDQ